MHRKKAFTLVELLVCVAIIAVLVGLMLPALAGARESARTIGCASNLRQLGLAWAMYADDFGGRAMPLAYTDAAIVGTGDRTYWWGADGSASGEVDHTRGFTWPYLDSSLSERSVYECPSQTWGSYRPQGGARTITSTYGYNGYYLCPPMTPGWSYTIGHRPWLRLDQILGAGRVFVFADTLLPGHPPSNNALLDPPRLYSGGKWKKNQSPTTSFRHGGGRPGTVGVRADGSAGEVKADPGDLVHAGERIGSVGTENDPHYVPDWRAW